MKLLPIEHYHLLSEPLKKVTINHLFARSVIEQKITGKIYVDDPAGPKTFYAVHPYGMSLLFGDSSNEEFNNRFRNHALNRNHTRSKHEWMQAFPAGWDTVLPELFRGCIIPAAVNTEGKKAGIIELNTRVNFRFSPKHFLQFKKRTLPPELHIVRTDSELFRNMKGSVVPAYFWKDEDDFLANGIGFSLLCDGELASTGYSSFIHDDQLELGIETVEKFRGKGFAAYACAALLDYCMEHAYEPVWACRLENTGSYKLAQKLGFIPDKEIPYYRLSN